MERLCRGCTMVEPEAAATNPAFYDDPIDFSDGRVTRKGRFTKKPKKVKLIPAERVVEYKSKSDQFCDYTSLIGFRLLNSKLPTRTRIAAACIMVTGVILLAYTATGAVGKFFASDTAKLCQFFLLNDRNDDDDDNDWNVLPEVRFCHGSQFAQATHRPSQWDTIVDDVRLLLHLHYTNSSSNLGGPSMLPLTEGNGPFKDFYDEEMPEMSGDECRKWYFDGQYGCNTTLRGRNYCSLFTTVSPSNLVLQMSPDISYVNFTDILREKGPCFNNWQRNRNDNEFFCCRLRLAYTMLSAYRTMNFTKFLDQIAITKEDHVVVSPDDLYKSELVWTSQYGQCLSYKTRRVNDVDKNSIKSVTFVVRTSTYDQVGVDGIFAMLVVDDVDANYINVFPGTMTTYYVKERISITDYSCSDGYPRICNDIEGYSIQTCRACYAARTKCNCYSPLQRGIRREKDRECTPIEAIHCAVNTINISMFFKNCKPLKWYFCRHSRNDLPFCVRRFNIHLGFDRHENR
uniref:SSD domain-containing protein n=1 Tax=Panagrellus redivivus TaxID=6233 RepID=A0A7E4UZZ4_PANRE